MRLQGHIFLNCIRHVEKIQLRFIREPALLLKLQRDFMKGMVLKENSRQPLTMTGRKIMRTILIYSGVSSPRAEVSW